MTSATGTEMSSGVWISLTNKQTKIEREEGEDRNGNSR